MRLLNKDSIDSEHILLGLVREGEGVAALALQNLEVSLQDVRDEVSPVVGVDTTQVVDTPQVEEPSFSWRVPGGGSLTGLTQASKNVMELALKESRQLGTEYIGTEHLLLGIVGNGECVAAQVLVNLGLDLSTVRHEVTRVLVTFDIGGAERTSMPHTVTRRRPPQDPKRTRFFERVGNGWTARVLRAGRTPPDYGAAYEDIAELVARNGIALDDVEPGQLVVSSVDTDEGPGLALGISCGVEDEQDRNADDDDGGQTP